MSDWSAQARQICRQIAAANPAATPKELRRLFRDAYPWEHRRYWPYKAWLTACKREILTREGKDVVLRPRHAGEAASVDPRQMGLFGGAP